MNFTLDKKKCIYIVIWLLIGLLSFAMLGKYASAPESHQATIASLDEKKATVLELTAATTATSALITLLPGDIGTPIAEKVADLSGYLLIVLCAVFLEKYLVTITGYAAFKIFIPAACVLFAANMMARNRSVDKLARRLLIFGICIFLVVPASVKVSDLIETTYQSQIDGRCSGILWTAGKRGNRPHLLYIYFLCIFVWTHVVRCSIRIDCIPGLRHCTSEIPTYGRKPAQVCSAVLLVWTLHIVLGSAVRRLFRRRAGCHIGDLLWT